MKTKWYLSTFVIILALLGVYNGNISSPNQEILLQFNSEEVTTEQSKITIEGIKQQLQNFGIENFHIQEGENGDFRISYHSSIDIESIKKVLSRNDNFALDFTSSNQNKKASKFPSKENTKIYNLDIYELHKTSDSNNSAGKYVWIVKQDYDRFTTTHIYPFLSPTDFNEPGRVIKLSTKTHRDITLVSDDTSNITPDVRAGPMA